MWWLYALLSAVFAALTAILAKIGVKGINADLATAIRCIVVLFLAWAIVFSRKEQAGITLLSKTNWIFLILSGIATGLSWVFYFRALQEGKVSHVALIDKLSVALVIVFSILFLGEMPTLKTLLGAVCIIGGTILLLF